jgi:hypothetical protein
MGGIVKRIPACAGMTSPLRRQGLAMAPSSMGKTIAKAFGLDDATQGVSNLIGLPTTEA